MARDEWRIPAPSQNGTGRGFAIRPSPFVIRLYSGPAFQGGHFMVTRVGINGFGRIGRQVCRAILEQHPDALEVVAVNDLADTKTNAHLFKYDTNYGAYPGKVEQGERALLV